MAYHINYDSQDYQSDDQPRIPFQHYLKDDSIGFSSAAFTTNYSDRKTYSEESDATAAMNSIISSGAYTGIKVISE